ncbi:MAG: hypothetical protein J6Z14_13590, partial [Prevotella sp.]|nr:hypothetical protein [Prevotella sp.]
MKKQLLKSMLVGVMTLAATGAWAQTVTTYDFEDGNALFTADSRISASVVEGTQTIYSQDFDLDGKAVSFKGASNAQNGYSFAHYDFSSLCDQAAKVKVEFETVLGNGARSIISIGDASVRGATGNSSKTTYSNKGAIFRVGTDKNYSYVNGSNVGSSTVVSQKWLKVTIEVDEVTKNYTYSIVNKATNEVLFSNGEEPIAFYSSDATNCTQIDMFGYINNSQMGLIDNLIITVTKDEREQANYTVNFLDSSNNPIKEAAVRSGAVGDGITLLPADKDPLWNAESTQKYIYQSDDSEGKTIEAAGTTVVNIIYRDAVIYNYTLLSNLGATLATGSDFEGESPRVGYPRYQLDGTDLYMAGVDNKEYRTTVNLTEDNVSKTVTYTLQEGKVVAFYTEAEDIAGITVATNDNIPVRASNALAATTTEDVTITTLAPGKYILHAGIFTSKSSYSGLAVNFGVGAETFAAEFGAVNLNEVASGEYGLGAPTAITYLASSSDNTQFDYIWIEKTGDVTAEEAAFLNAKAQLQNVIVQATALNAYANDETLTNAIKAAQATLGDETATLEDIAVVATALQLAATTAAKNTLTEAVTLAKTFGVGDTAAAEALLAKEDATLEELAAALQVLATTALPAAKENLGKAKSFFATFAGDAAAALAEDFATLETAMEGTNIGDILTAAQALGAKALPYAKEALGKVVEYLDGMDDETLSADIAKVKAAMETDDLWAIVSAGRKMEADFETAIPTFIEKLDQMAAAAELAGKNGVDELKTAIAAAKEAIAADGATIVDKGLAIRNLMVAIAEFQDANFEPVDWTASVSTDGWLSDQGSVGNYTKDVAQKEQYNGSTTANCDGDVLYQTVEGLIN